LRPERVSCWQSPALYAGNVDYLTISKGEALDLIERPESHVWDQKSAKSGGAQIQKMASALANADGGDFAVGIEDRKAAASGLDRWQGFAAMEDGNFIQQALVKEIRPPVPYSINWLQINTAESAGLVALISITKSPSVHHTAADEVWIRRGPQNFRLNAKQIADLMLSKGTVSYEDQILERYTLEDLTDEDELAFFLQNLSPTFSPEAFARNQRLFDRDTQRASAAAAVLFAAVPPAVIPRKCAVKIARYETKEAAPTRDHLAADPETVEGPARVVIERALEIVTSMVEDVSILQPDGSLAPTRYPPEALKEIIVNAVIHRDYNISDDISIMVFDNRVEVKSPGRLPGHMTLDNLLDERFARNPTLVRLLNKYPDPPNKDIGEGLNTVVSKMAEAKLEKPWFAQEDTAFVVYLGHTPLARPEELILEYLQTHDEVTNATARELCAIASENAMKTVFYRLRDAGKIERVPGKQGPKAAWRKARNGSS
jgi:ATP-dependent DNA helicase RecG